MSERVPGRLIVDASALVRWWGPPVGIVRVEAEIIRYLLAHEPAALLSVFDTRSRQFRPLDRSIARLLIEDRAVVETGLMPDPRPIERGPLRAALTQIERKLRPALRIRRTLACMLDERFPPGLAHAVPVLVNLLLDRRLRARVTDRHGGRRNLFRLDSVLGPPFQLGPHDLILSAGSDWGDKDPDAMSALKSQTGFRLVVVCYDLIPALFPQFYSARDVDVFTRYFQAALGFVDRFICISRRTAADLAWFAAAHGRYNLDIRSERLGADAVRNTSVRAPLPAGLTPERYVLFVSTIEPRKNHGLLLRVWRRLAAGEHGGTGGFKLVFAGRPGWMTEDIMASLSEETVFSRDVIHVASPSDIVLGTLYANSAFTVYPSHYEGFGLPVIESFAHGKPAIASSAGALPEAAAGLAPCIDPTDEDTWVAEIGRWISDPAYVGEQASRIRAEFSWPSWSDAAGRILTIAREP